MAATGPLPKTNKLGRTPNLDWVEVPNIPFDAGRTRELPPLPRGRKWDPMVVRWWELVRVMPHCALWTATDWLFAEETALQKNTHLKHLAAGTEKTTAETEIRRREDQMGLTLEARRKNRIRYIDPPDGETDTSNGGSGAKVTSIAARRQRMLADD